jgi:hypothetical protein
MLQALGLFMMSFGIASFVYKILALAFASPVFGGPPRMFMYHLEHPYQYIAIITALYSVLATAWMNTAGWRQEGIRRYITIMAMILGTVVLASIPGGILWQIHDMHAGFIPHFWFRKLLEGAWWGLEIGWLILLLSFPYNVIMTVIAVIGTDKAEKTTRKWRTRRCSRRSDLSRSVQSTARAISSRG